MQDDTIISEFTLQAESFNTSTAAQDGRTLDELMRLASPGAEERWLEVACGSGIVSRRIAPAVREVHGVDMTPAMIEVARREAAAAGLSNATFAVGDATALELPTAGVDGAITRFSMHHIPAPIRLLGELARVVRPGGRVILADHVADPEADAAAWSQEIERLRDPSHWACLPVAFDDWVQRGSGGPGARAVIERQLDHRPDSVECFQITERDGRRFLELQLWLSRWQR